MEIIILLVLLAMGAYSFVMYYRLQSMRTRYKQESDDCFDAVMRLEANQPLTPSQIELLHRIDPDVATEYEASQLG